MRYAEFIESKSNLGGQYGFNPVFMPDKAFDFQVHLIDWAIKKGRAAIFADCGLGKSLIELAWAENVVRKTGKRVLLLTPLAVAQQIESEGVKFGIECSRAKGGKSESAITVANYERLHLFNPDDFGAVICDESSILKAYDGKRRAMITEIGSCILQSFQTSLKLDRLFFADFSIYR